MAELLRPSGVPPGARLLVAVSGGVDSLVLLHRLAGAGLAPLAAVHVDHRLQGTSAQWAAHCERFARGLGVGLEVLRVQVGRANGTGLEAAARAARYEALAQAMRAGDCLVTAHHQDDQAETVLLRLLRGAGSRGAAAMRELLPFATGWLWRPLLATPRAQIRAYASAHGIEAVDDPMNRDVRYARAWLRAEVLPLITARYPRAAEVLARHAQAAAQDASALEELARLDAGGNEGPLATGRLAPLSDARARNLLRHWLGWQGGEPPSQAQLERVFREVIGARGDAMPWLRLGPHELRRYRHRLYLMAVLPVPPPRWQAHWAEGARLLLPQGCGVLAAASAPPRPLQVHLSRGGERLVPAGRAHHHSLRILFQEAAVPPWVRRRTPLISLDGELAAVPGVAQSARFVAWCDEHAWQPRWEEAPPGASS